MSGFYRMEPLRWDRGTDNLTLEQEAAYLRVCNAIYAADQPIAENYRALAGMWRCNERKAKRLLSELIEAGKVYVEAGWIKNDKALSDVETRLELRVKRQLAGHSGGIESGKSRAKSLENNDTAEASGSTRREENRGSVAKATDAEGVDGFNQAIFTRGVAYLVRNGVKERHARSIIGKWKSQAGDKAVYDALADASRAGSPDPVAYITAALKPKPSAHDQKLASWGIGDAQPVRVEHGSWHSDPEQDAGEADLSAMLPVEEGEEPTHPLSFGDADGGWDRGALPPLRLVAGGAL